MSLLNRIADFGMGLSDIWPGPGKKADDAHTATESERASNSKIFINPTFNISFILRFCLFAVIGGGLFSAILLYFCHDTLTTSFEGARIVIRETSQAIMPAIVYTSLVMLGTAVAAVAAVTFWIIYRIRKPLYRFEKDVKSIATGNLAAQIKYRPHDQTTVLAGNFNQMLLSFEAKIIDIQQGFKDLIEAAGPESVPKDLVFKLIRIHRSIDQHFRVVRNQAHTAETTTGKPKEESGAAG